MSDEDVPPKSIWHDHRRLAKHFKEVKKKWKGDKDDEKPEGTFADYESGKAVTIRNEWMKYIEAVSQPEADDFSVI